MYSHCIVFRVIFTEIMPLRMRTAIYHIIQFLGVCAGIYNYRRLVKPTGLLFWLLVYTFISELVALYIRLNYGNNVYIYHLYNPIQYTLVT